MSSCFFFGRVPVQSLSSKNNRYIIETSITVSATEYDAVLHTYLDAPIQQDSAIELVDTAFANNGNETILLAADKRDIEVLGDVPPSRVYQLHMSSM